MDRRLMARKGGYTSDPKAAMRGMPSDVDHRDGYGAEQARRFANLEPEAVDPAIVDELGLSRVHKERYRSEKAHELDQRDNRDRSSRLRAAQTDALRAGVDLTQFKRAIDAQIDLMARAISRAAA